MLKPAYTEQVLNDGIDESAEELVGMGGVDRLYNGVYRKEGGITKRNGFSYPTLPSVDESLGATAEGHTLVVNGGALHVLRKLDNIEYSTVGDGINQRANKGFVVPGYVEALATLRDGRGFRNCNVAIGRTASDILLACIVGQVPWSPTTELLDEVIATVVEVDTGIVLATTSFVGRRARPVFRNGIFHIFFSRDNTGWEVCSTRWNNGGTNEFEGSVTIHSTGKADSDIAVWPSATVSTETFVAWMDTTTNLTIKRINTSNTIVATVDVTTPAANCVALCQGKNHPTLLHVLYGRTSSVNAEVFSILATLGGSPTSSTVALTKPSSSYDWTQLAVEDLGTAGQKLVACGTSIKTSVIPDGELSTIYAALGYTMGATLPSAYTASAQHRLNNQTLLAHPMCVYPDGTAVEGNSTAHLLLSRWTDTPGLNGDPNSRLSTPNSYLACLPIGTNYANAGLSAAHSSGFGTAHTPLSATVLVDSAYNADATLILGYPTLMPSHVGYDSTHPAYYVAQLELEEFGGDRIATYGIKLLRFRFSTNAETTVPLPRASLGGLTYIGGNQLRYYDGVDVGEAVPLYCPPTPEVTRVTSGGSLDADAVYNYSFVWVWEDRKGLVHRSAPTPPLSVTTSGANNKFEFDWGSEDIFPTALNAITAERYWRLEVYRTEGGDSTLYLEQVTPLDDGVAGGVTSSADDATITSNKVLYTVGDILPNQHPPAFKSMAAVGNRLFGISAVDPRTVWFSKEVEEGFAAEFNSVLTMRFEASESAPVALAGMGDLLVVFTEREAWAVSTHGGPNALGVGTFGIPERIATDCGASSADAAVSCPLGVLVHGSSGLMVLTPQGAVEVPVVMTSAASTMRVRRACHFPERKEVWFRFRSGKVSSILVFSYAKQQLRWSIWEVGSAGLANGPDVRDFVSVAGVPYLLVYTTGSSYRLMRLNTSTYLDGGSEHIPVTVRTRWFKPEGHLGASRFWRVHLFGTGGVSGLTAKVYVMDVSGLEADDDSAEDFHRGTYVWTSTQLALDGRLVHLRRRLQSQKGAAARVEVVLTTPVGGAQDTKGPVLHAVGWDYGTSGASDKRGATFEAA